MVAEIRPKDLPAVTVPTALDKITLDGATSRSITYENLFKGADNGTVALPSLAFLSDPDTGFYRVSANVGGLSAGGVSLLQWDGSVVSAATGVKITSAAAAGGVALAAISSGTNESIKIDAKGSGEVIFGTTSTGGVKVLGNDAVGRGMRFYRGNGTDYSEFYKSSGGIGSLQDPLNIYTSTLAAVAISFGRDGSIAAAGGVKSLSGTLGVGYGTGAGGTITQSTSKSTGVTLDKVCGQITMNNAALNAGVSVSFTLTNSTIAITDTVDVCIQSGATADSYHVSVTAVAAGSCRIQVRNFSGGNLSEALVLNFGVNKRVNA